MFRRNKKGPSGQANRLRNEAKPNTLTWATSDATDDADQEFEPTEALDPAESDEAFDDFEGEDEADDPEVLARREADLEAELQRQAEEFGLTKANPVDLYGPNGESVAIVLQALEELTPEDADDLADAWDAVDAAERDVVERVLRRRHRTGKYADELASAEDSVAAWLRAQKPVDDDEASVLRVVAAAARDAVDAFVLDQDIDDADYAMLSGPWLEIMGSDDGAQAETDDQGETGAQDAETEAEGETGGAAETDAVADEIEAAKGQGDDVLFGPSTPLLMDVFERLRGLSMDDLAKLVKVWKETDREDLKAAHQALDKAVREDRDWRDQVRLAQDRVVDWASQRESRQGAIPPIADCVAALVMADVLEPEDAQTLYAPWAAVVGEPKLPTFEDDSRP